jgi:hypothetical protein
MKSVFNFTKLSEVICAVGLKLVFWLLSWLIQKKVIEIPVPVPYFYPSWGLESILGQLI